jgi:hypothetical protein
MKFYLPPQLKSLAIAFAIFIIAFLFVRHLLIPDSFGEYGHYRAASLEDNANIAIKYSGQDACFDCHQDIQDQKSEDVHSGIHCEICHGPGEKHVESGEASDIIKPDGREFCGSCHAKNAAKPQFTIIQVDLSKHNIGKDCIECHNPHQPWKMNEENLQDASLSNR